MRLNITFDADPLDLFGDTVRGILTDEYADAGYPGPVVVLAEGGVPLTPATLNGSIEIEGLCAFDYERWHRDDPGAVNSIAGPPEKYRTWNLAALRLALAAVDAGFRLSSQGSDVAAWRHAAEAAGQVPL